LTFHRDGKAEASEMGDNGPYGTSYGEAYGDANGSSYGGAYGGKPGKTKGKWALSADGKNIIVSMTDWNKTKTLFFGTKSYYQHRCYSDANSIP
jgi:hypothetical protein